MKCMWRIINKEIGLKNRERVDFTDLIKQDSGQPFATKLELVNSLNNKFTSAAQYCGAPVADTLACVRVLTAAVPASDASLLLTPFTPAEVIGILHRHIAPKPSTDIYDLSTNLLRKVIFSICDVLTHLYNQCRLTGTFPDVLKRVKVSPIYKGKGKKCCAESYRPISLVPCISKVLEVGLNSRLLAFWTPRGFMSERQYAYRAGRSTIDLVREVVWRVLGAREAGRHVAVICCDLSRAFDTADHALIASKLRHYGISGPALTLVMSFMSDRMQQVVGDGGAVCSAESHNYLGVPQGSCLSNTLFSILLNDLPSALREHEVFMYADDVTVVVTAATVDELERVLNKTAETLHNWFTLNGLALNKDKTCFMRINLNGHKTSQMKILAAGTALQQVQCAKLLGFHFDSALVWNTHIDELCKRLGRSCFALRRLASTASADVVRNCYFATVHSALTYGTELWARASEWRRVFSMQKRAVRAIVSVPDDVSAREYFKELSIMTLPCMWVYSVAVVTHSNLDKFKRRGTNPMRQLRSDRYQDRLVVPFHKLSKSEQSVWVCGAAVYNRLPLDVRNATSVASFKSKLKKWLHERQFYDFHEYFKLDYVETTQVETY